MRHLATDDAVDVFADDFVAIDAKRLLVGAVGEKVAALLVEVSD